MTRRLLVLACLAFGAQGAFASDCTATQPSTGSLIGQGLLDPDTPDAERQRLSERLLCSALAGNGISQDVAGSLYRWGPRHPGHVFPEDHEKARDLLTAAAMQGRRSAMLKLAELELADDHAREAMVWIQVEGALYRRQTGKADVIDDTTVASYYVMLLKRATDALGDYDVATLDKDIDARIAAVDRQTAMRTPSSSKKSNLGGGKLPSQQHVANAPPQDLMEGAYAQYFTEIGPDGRVARSWLIDAYPNPGAGTRLLRPLMQTRWNPQPAGDTTMRYGLVPVSMSSFKHNIHLKSP